MGVSWFANDPFANCWLLDPYALRPGQFIDALKLRTNTFGTRVALGRAQRGAEVLCRRCGTKAETLGHVLGECVAGKRLRIERHNCIVGDIAERCGQMGMEVAVEQTITLPDGTALRPDLVIKHQDKVSVMDVTLPFENKQSLLDAAHAKVVKYTPALPTVQETFHATSGEVIPVVVGARGSLPRTTVTALRGLGFESRGSLCGVALLALRTSIHIARCHMDYVDRPHPRVHPP